ncbi:MocR-like pyridoxine biosynthesis transcription factor PdxR [Pseudonocardia adelaidensis]|uniref:MocR-like pyridoxine biosynthesis transcription factor PdxR n=1 Tax=Pseudonocardia adelaidensis TaxID=648754 RepID=UPI0031E9BB70
MYREIRSAIVEGRVRPPDALPSIRDLAQMLAVSRNTVAIAYDRLVADGFIASRMGVGMFVRRAAQTAPAAYSVRSVLRPRPLWEQMDDSSDTVHSEAAFDFRNDLPDAGEFPFATWRSLLATELRCGAVSDAALGHPAGHAGLRAAIARHVGLSRSMHVDADDVCVTNGAQQAIDLVARVVVEPGDVVAVEDPGCPSAREAFRAHGARMVGVRVDGEGLVVDALPEAARLVFVTPSHQNPLGMTMSPDRRRDLLEWAERSGAAVVEDDRGSEFHAGPRPPAPLRNTDHSDRVLYISSFSTVLLPTLRLGYVIVPPSLRDAVHRAKYVAGGSANTPLQAAAARFIEEGRLTRHIRRMRNIYAARRHLLRAALGDELSEHLRLVPSAAGLRLAVLLHRHTDDRLVVARAVAAGVTVRPLSGHAVTAPARHGLLLGCGAIPSDRIAAGVRRLRYVLDALPTASEAIPTADYYASTGTAAV